MLYLTCIVSFDVLAWSVYPWVWSLYMKVRSWQINCQFIMFFFICMLYLTCISSFYVPAQSVYLRPAGMTSIAAGYMYGIMCQHNLYTRGHDLYCCRLHVWDYVLAQSVWLRAWAILLQVTHMWLCASTFCIPAGMTSIVAGYMYGINYNEA